MAITGGIEANPYCADGICPKCSAPFCVIALEEFKARNAVCLKCNTHMELRYRQLVVNADPLICPYCKMDPVYVERKPGFSIFVMVNNKIARHLCDLEYEAKQRKKGEAS
jgi:hypothetical protein